MKEYNVYYICQNKAYTKLCLYFQKTQNINISFSTGNIHQDWLQELIRDRFLLKAKATKPILSQAQTFTFSWKSHCQSKNDHSQRKIRPLSELGATRVKSFSAEFLLRKQILVYFPFWEKPEYSPPASQSALLPHTAPAKLCISVSVSLDSTAPYLDLARSSLNAQYQHCELSAFQELCIWMSV